MLKRQKFRGKLFGRTGWKEIFCAPGETFVGLERDGTRRAAGIQYRSI